MRRGKTRFDRETVYTRRCVGRCRDGGTESGGIVVVEVEEEEEEEMVLMVVGW